MEASSDLCTPDTSQMSTGIQWPTRAGYEPDIQDYLEVCQGPVCTWRYWDAL